MKVRNPRDGLADSATGFADFAADVRFYLALHPRQLPSKYLYDDLGSALFEAITLLPWYPLARAEMRLIRAHGAEILSALDGLSTVVELGPGNGTKLAALLERAGPGRGKPRAHLIDVSPAALARAARLLIETDRADVTVHPTTYELGMAEIAPTTRAARRTLVVFFGSNIGNFDPPGSAAFLQMLRAALHPGDALLLGADLVKPEADLLLAYDDPLGVTAAFNRNLLVRITRELGAAIDPGAFRHRATWNASPSRVEMHLISARDNRIVIPAAEVDTTIAAGETIWTESSYKYRVEGLERMLRQGGFEPVSTWVDERDRFALALSVARS